MECVAMGTTSCVITELPNTDSGKPGLPVYCKQHGCMWWCGGCSWLKDWHLNFVNVQVWRYYLWYVQTQNFKIVGTHCSLMRWEFVTERYVTTCWTTGSVQCGVGKACLGCFFCWIRGIAGSFTWTLHEFFQPLLCISWELSISSIGLLNLMSLLAYNPSCVLYLVTVHRSAHPCVCICASIDYLPESIHAGNTRWVDTKSLTQG